MIPRVKGTDDILPPESAKWRRLLRAFDELAERYGYDLAVMPVLEATELFARGVGAFTDVVEKQMFSFEDRRGRQLTLRPEFTVGMVRAYLEAGGTGVMKLAASGPQFRYEQPQKGRRRQFYQLDVECLGDPDPRADVEIIEFSYRLLDELGVPAPIVQLNSIGDTADRDKYRDLLQHHLRGIAGRLTLDSQRRIDTNPLRVLDSKEDAAILGDAPVPLDHLGPESSAHFAAVRSGLEAAGIVYEIAPRMVRGLDYYNRTVFEMFSPAFEAAQSSLCGGGRYDPLAGMVGSRVPVAGVGVAFGCERIVAAMPDTSVPRLDLFVAVATPERIAAAAEWVRMLRGSGVRVDWIGGSKSLKAQFKAADRSGAGAVAIVGDEWRREQVRTKHLGTGEEATVAIEEVTAWLSR